MTKLFSRKEMLSRIFGARKAKRLETSLVKYSGQVLMPYSHKSEEGLIGHFVFNDTLEGHKFWWSQYEKLTKLGYSTNDGVI